ncbi:unnamed protein product [Symbiodinium sp. CCMP2592]|nr:unnamed protein product [Symbiodinium sp. CCMP2592]
MPGCCKPLTEKERLCETHNIRELREVCKGLGMTCRGTKDEILERILPRLQQEAETAGRTPRQQVQLHLKPEPQSRKQEVKLEIDPEPQLRAQAVKLEINPEPQPPMGPVNLKVESQQGQRFWRLSERGRGKRLRKQPERYIPSTLREELEDDDTSDDLNISCDSEGDDNDDISLLDGNSEEPESSVDGFESDSIVDPDEF